MAENYLKLGWTLKHEFRDQPENEPYEYLFEWMQAGAPVGIQSSELRTENEKWA